MGAYRRGDAGVWCWTGVAFGDCAGSVGEVGDALPVAPRFIPASLTVTGITM